MIYTGNIRLRRSARAAARRGEWARSAHFYERLLASLSASVGDRIQLGHAYKEGGDLAKAEWHYREAIETDPFCAEAYRQLGHLLRRCQRVGEAIQAFTFLLALDPTDHEARGYTESCGCEGARFEEDLIVACGHLSSFVPKRKAPRSLGIMLLLRRMRARSAARMGRWDVAAHLYRHILASQPDRAAIQIQYGHALKQLGDLRTAERAYRWAFILTPDDSAILVQLGHLQKLMGHPSAAARAYQEAEKRNRRFLEGIGEAIEPDVVNVSKPMATITPPSALSPHAAALLRRLHAAIPS